MMGTQDVGDVALIRHVCIAAEHQGSGVDGPRSALSTILL